jgi:Exonuclease V - a 5' deoxyribonuclease
MPNRIVDMLANLRALQLLGKCRELSVFGFVDGTLVHGTIVCPDLLLYFEFV